MICKVCGAQNGDRRITCSSCGNHLVAGGYYVVDAARTAPSDPSPIEVAEPVVQDIPRPEPAPEPDARPSLPEEQPSVASPTFRPAPSRAGPPAKPDGATASAAASRRGTLEGEILWIREPTLMEWPDRDWAMTICRFLWLMGFLCFPPLLGAYVFWEVGPVACIVLAAVFMVTIGRIGIGNIFYFLGILSVFGLWPQREGEQVPVCEMEIRESPSGQRRQARLKGRLIAGFLRQGHRVSLRGRFRDGVFRASGGRVTSIRPHPRIILRRTFSRLWLMLTVLAYGAVLWSMREHVMRLIRLLG